MKLTKLQRYTAYCILLEEAENPGHHDGCLFGSDCFGICYMWHCLTDDILYNYFNNTLPELYNKRKYHDWDYWNTWEERKEAIKQCIIETHP